MRSLTCYAFQITQANLEMLALELPQHAEALDYEANHRVSRRSHRRGQQSTGRSRIHYHAAARTSGSSLTQKELQ